LRVTFFLSLTPRPPPSPLFPYTRSSDLTSRAHYGSIITTRTYDDRLRTLDHVRRAGITICSGGIIGMGESIDDRCDLLRTLANRSEEHTSELQSRFDLVCRLLLEKKKRT